jgi:hypothetical protein
MQDSTTSNRKGYLKYTYFVDDDGLAEFKRWAKKQSITLVKAKNKPCEVLHHRVRAGFVSPKVWNRDCRRQGSWYRESSQAGRHLIVSQVPLEEMDEGTSLTVSDFTPPVLPTSEELQELVSSSAYQERKPNEWEQCTQEDKLKFSMGREAIKETLGVVPHCENESFDDVFVSHCANHSNFLYPRFYVEENGHICPYSIGDTFHICSACVEFFNLAGRERAVKYVVPCPGAVTAAALPINCYIRVKTIL